jgi:hypothetical protein
MRLFLCICRCHNQQRLLIPLRTWAEGHRPHRAKRGRELDDVLARSLYGCGIIAACWFGLVGVAGRFWVIHSRINSLVLLVTRSHTCGVHAFAAWTVRVQRRL